jgi:hypothetical protein
VFVVANQLDESTLEAIPARRAAGTTGRGRVARKARRTQGVVVGRFAGWDDSGTPLVILPGRHAVPARSVVALDKSQIDQDVVLQFENADPNKPIVMGFLQPTAPPPTPDHPGQPPARTVRVQVDGERLVFTGEKEIVLRCGEASITLTRAGKVLIRGEYVLSRASGLNRIKGGVVHIN